ncbi:hypothetical protein GF359_10230 [candidate division WOR-3 bacterium]|uniref:T9SS type A sorting domain-containing protein n=1 Tax=candidate division WOR-3 bacterium TaxID=2052148 RepID=A0A9D5QDZ5_UNCW3|nr:hypothetical protein [candidate division WOR-3 bacterium]MBD3365577.1 hypothetical protein [candidate division WOR-3 bacterium]
MNHNLKVIVLASAVILFVPVHIFGGWIQTYYWDDHNDGECVHQTRDGGYIAIGDTYSVDSEESDLCLLKTDNLGISQWSRLYGGAGNDEGYSGIQVSDGYVIAGVTTSYGSGTWDLWVFKTDLEGDSVWAFTYGGEGAEGGNCIEITEDGGFIVSGSTDSFGSGSFDGWLLKLNSQGDTVWTRTYGGADYEHFFCVETTDDGGYVLAGKAGADPNYSDLWLVRVDSYGNTLWTRTYGTDKKDEGYCVRQTDDGGYIVVGFVDASPSCTVGDLWLLKTDESGDTLWTRRYGGDFNADQGSCIQITNDGSYIITGWTKSFGEGGFDLWLLKTDSHGDILWTRTYGGEGHEIGAYCEQTNDGGYIIAGYTESFAVAETDLWLIKTDSAGLVNAVNESVVDTKGYLQYVSKIDREIIIKYRDMPRGFSASVFDASGRRIDEILNSQASGKVAWGDGFSPGVYFMWVSTPHGVQRSKVVLTE